ncbi:phosphotransferase family protein [Aspergillus heteromorphus CBS 117.55]|uniref:Phosphotransferase family protein n=1 Tax=Aspergillus heteromorphus CBS 117.55 TaxID=1448321 RepID=A0A317WCL1_9EURO|nr:phosphotransferase family protein [Aspergillus heteromorphus CBS 117.55]PWY81890.1 phosphotransferase family protein [Aspergillus heteromorphus CBS 117.55]
MIFRDSSFYRENPRAALPTPSEVRAISKKSAGTQHISFNRPPPVMISSLGLVVKYGADVTVVEAQTQLMLSKHLKGQIPIPDVFGWIEDGGQSFLYMSLIQGETLQERWSDMNEDERLSVCQELNRMVKAEGLEGFEARHLGRQPLNEIVLSSHPEITGPFQGTDAVQRFQDACGIEIWEEVPIVFTHHDLVHPPSRGWLKIAYIHTNNNFKALIRICIT